MLLRSITRHVQTQNWFAITIDFAIVVFGVFRGIEVSNWNDSRQRDAQQENYLIRLQKDLRVAEAGRQQRDA